MENCASGSVSANANGIARREREPARLIFWTVRGETIKISREGDIDNYQYWVRVRLELLPVPTWLE